jgi:dihydroneopterin aldolase
MDTVFIQDYSVEAKHGYYKEEHAKKQRFIVSVYVCCDTHEAGGTDN